jgi:two-component system chemotaxis response regulator CheB
MVFGPKTRILIVDDSAVMRSVLRSAVCADPGLEVAGTAANGEAALSAIESLRPGLILLDVDMPVLDGLATLRKLRARGHKMPVIMCSSLTQRGADVTVEALACGASDSVAKPAEQAGREAALQSLAQELIPRINALINRRRSVLPVIALAPLIFPLVPSADAQPLSCSPSVVAIGVSTGGPAALDLLLPALPASFPIPVLIVQHMPELFTRPFAERLDGRCVLRVWEAAEGEPVRPGNIYIARGNWHLEVLAAALAGQPKTMHLSQGPPENHCRPSVDVLFCSVAAAYGAGALALVLTGMGSDGMQGCRAIRNNGGSVLAQDEASSTVWGMPGAVAHAGLAQKLLPLSAIAPELIRLAGRSRGEAREPREAAV